MESAGITRNTGLGVHFVDVPDVLHMLCLHSLNEILRYPAHSARCAAYVQRSVDMHLLGNHLSASLVCVDQADCWVNKAGKGRKIGSMLVTKQLYRWWQNQTNAIG